MAYSGDHFCLALIVLSTQVYIGHILLAFSTARVTSPDSQLGPHQLGKTVEITCAVEKARRICSIYNWVYSTMRAPMCYGVKSWMKLLKSTAHLR